MASAKNKVIAGDYEKKIVTMSGSKAVIAIGIGKLKIIDNSTVESYEVIDESTKKSATSAVGRAAVGAFFLGPIGIAAGLTAKTKGIYTIAIQFKDGTKSLLEVDDKIYKAIITKAF